MKPSAPLLVLLTLLSTGCGEATEEAEHTRRPVPSRTKPPPAHPELGDLPSPPRGTGEGLHTDFARAFTDGLVIDRGRERLTVTVVDAGRLQVGSGVLLVGDPGWVGGLQALPIGVPKGKYRVQLSRVRGEDKDSGEAGERIAAMRLLLGKGQAVRWLYLASIGVDTGSAAFMTPTAADVLERQQDAAAQRYERRLHGDDAPEPADTIDGRLQASFSQDMLAPVLLQSHPRGPHNFVACSSGLGDGSYDVYVGLDAAGALVELAVDFGVLLEPVEDQVVIEDMAELPPGPIDLGPLGDLGIKADRGRQTETWLTIDASSIWGDPVHGSPEIVIEDRHGQRVFPMSSMQGGHHHIDAPRDEHARVIITVKVGVKPL